MHGQQNIKKKTDIVHMNVTLRRVSATINAMDEQYVLHILSVCL